MTELFVYRKAGLQFAKLVLDSVHVALIACHAAEEGWRDEPLKLFNYHLKFFTRKINVGEKIIKRKKEKNKKRRNEHFIAFHYVVRVLVVHIFFVPAIARLVRV